LTRKGSFGKVLPHQGGGMNTIILGIVLASVGDSSGNRPGEIEQVRVPRFYHQIRLGMGRGDLCRLLGMPVWSRHEHDVFSLEDGSIFGVEYKGVTVFVIIIEFALE
jgi:hypothetical protein